MCLKQAEEQRKTSIAFPTLGTGSLDFPINVMAETLTSCCMKFGKEERPKHLDNIFIIIYDDINNRNRDKEEKVCMCYRSYKLSSFFQIMYTCMLIISSV